MLVEIVSKSVFRKSPGFSASSCWLTHSNLLVSWINLRARYRRVVVGEIAARGGACQS